MRCKRCCDLHNFQLSQIPRVYFVKSQWEDLEGKDEVSLPFLVYRGLFLVYFIVCLSHSIYRIQNPQFWAIAATNWTFWTQCLYAGLFFSVLLFRFVREKYGAKAKSKSKSEDTEMDMNDFEMKNHHYHHEYQVEPHAVKMSTKVDGAVWLLLSLSATIPYIITFGYWTFVYSPEEIIRNNTTVGWSLTVHGINAILALVDTFVIAIPVRIAHCVYTVFLTLSYALFTCIYEYAGGSYKIPGRPFIYSFLNWREKPEWAVVSCLGAAVAAFLLHLLFWTLYKLRLFIVAKIKGK